mgnify:CR=1 FL=1
MLKQNKWWGHLSAPLFHIFFLPSIFFSQPHAWRPIRPGGGALLIPASFSLALGRPQPPGKLLQHTRPAVASRQAPPPRPPGRSLPAPSSPAPGQPRRSHRRRARSKRGMAGSGLSAPPHTSLPWPPRTMLVREWRPIHVAPRTPEPPA